MKKILLSTLFLLWASIGIAQSVFPLVPYPNQLTEQKGKFILPETVTLFMEEDRGANQSFVDLLQEDIKKAWNVNTKIVQRPEEATLRITTKDKGQQDKPGYELLVADSGVLIKASNLEGAFYATRTFLQLLQQNNKGKWECQAVFIEDFPRFSYRGMHLDVGRHFFPVPVIKQYIDWLAYHKLNKFHWHLTEDQGWRIEIKQFPLLTSVGGWRNGTLMGRYPGKGNDNTPHGGFYTQAEIREVVAYAQERFVEVIPEIEMPGHSSAAIAAYPWLSCFPNQPTSIPANMISQQSIKKQKEGAIKLVQETWGVFDDVFCAGNDSTFMFLEKVIDEVSVLFPSRYIHIGGDECPKTHWKKCARCQQRIRSLQLKDEHELQSYFVKRIEDYLNKKGKTLIGWDEILEGGLAPNAVVMSWRGESGGIEAAKERHEVIMTPGQPVYFDHSQSENEDSVTIGGYNPLEKVYHYDPVPQALAGGFEKYVLGTQANVWTEYMPHSTKIQYMVFPRIAALSEICWTVPDKKSWSGFEKRLPTFFERYKEWGVQTSSAYFDIAASVRPQPGNRGIELALTTKAPGTTLHWIENNNTSPYRNAIPIAKSGVARAQSKDTITGAVKSRYEQLFQLHKATGRKISLTTPASRNYPGDGAFTLVNGIKASKGFSRTRDYLGFSGSDAEALIDLGEQVSVGKVEVSFLQRASSWIYPPAAVEVFYSEDGNQFMSAASMSLESTDFMEEKMKLKELKTNIKCRFIKVLVKNYGLIPAGQAGEGKPAWLFLDEISIY
ncbi:MAG: beta-N-acetylhexosaminidase [Chitinophagia bacterium]|nr:beta-N-acetylhexosaminidase [Chitinophagia bacterium]